MARTFAAGVAGGIAALILYKLAGEEAAAFLLVICVGALAFESEGKKK